MDLGIIMEQYNTIVLSARYPYLRYESIKELAKQDGILQKSLVSFDTKLPEVSISGFKVFDYENSLLANTIKNPNWLNSEVPKINLLRTEIKNCLSLSEDSFVSNIDVSSEITDKIVAQNNVSSKMEILNFLYENYYKEHNNVETKTLKSQNHALATFYIYFDEYLNLNIDFKDWSKEYLEFKPVQFFQINEMEKIRFDILKDFKVRNIDYAIESMKYMREEGYTELTNKVKSDRFSFDELKQEVNNYNQLYDLNNYKVKICGIKLEENYDINNKFTKYIDFLANNYETIQKASIYEVLNNRGTVNEYS